jgi:membrane protease YdiL (CAAX protease family)
MSNISFLDNVTEGKNNKGSYIFTIGITVIGGTFASILFMVLFMVIYFLISGKTDLGTQINFLNYNPLLLLVLVGISYGIYSLLFYLCIRFIHKKKFISLINTGNNIKWIRIAKGALLWLGIMTIFTILPMFFQEGSFSFNFNPGPFIVLLVLSVLIFPIQASFEEIFFRGYLMQAFGLFSKKPIVPLMITSIIFAVVHFLNGSSLIISLSIVISALILGLMLGIIALGENGLETAIGAHIANNIYVAVFLNSSDSGLGGLPSLITTQSTDPLSGIPLLIIMAVLMLIIIFWNKKEALYAVFR